MCGIEVLAIALQLARGLVAAPAVIDEGTAWPSNMRLSIPISAPACTVEWDSAMMTRRYLTPVQKFQCQLDMAIARDADAKAKLADYKEFQRLSKVCLPEPRIKTGIVDAHNDYIDPLSWATGTGTVTSLIPEGGYSSIILQAPDPDSVTIIGPLEFHDVENNRCPVWKNNHWASGNCK